MINKKRILALSCVIFFLTCQSLKNSTIYIPVSSKEISYQNTIRPILKNYCTTCHSGNFPASGLNLTTYSEVKAKIEEGVLLSRINDKSNPMPQGGLMPIEMREAIKQWAINGFKKDSIFNPNQTPIDRKDKDSVLYSSIEPIDLNVKGFDFFEFIKGHWVGDLMILGQKYDWFSFDYRPISSSHIHGIYEAGTMGNIMNSFFITNFNGKKTIMARNGGILNGIYRTSYFVLDKVELSKNRNYFRFVDAYGGMEIMWMDLEFVNDKLNFNSYTSRFGLKQRPTLHMQFEAKRKHIDLSNSVAEQLDYPQNTIDIDFSQGLPRPDWGSDYTEITSASYIYEDNGESLFNLAKRSGDPYSIKKLPFLSQLNIEIEQNEKIREHKLIIYLSKESFTSKDGQLLLEYGYLKEGLFEGVFSFPELASNQEKFSFTYLHPGDYFLTIVADKNQDGFVSKGDITNKSIAIRVNPNSEQTIQVKDIILENE